MLENTLIDLTADIVSAHVSNNKTAADDLPTLIQSIFAALSATTNPAELEAPKQEPAVSVRSSIKNDYIICLEDGAKLKMLKRYLRNRFDMSPDDYRAKWGLPNDYPMVAPAYAETRRILARTIGLGRKQDTTPTARPKLSIAAAKGPLSSKDAAASKRVRPTKAKPDASVNGAGTDEG